MKAIEIIVVGSFFCGTAVQAFGQETTTYAEKLGWGKGERVIMFHVDDAGMSYESNQGAQQALEKGVASSVSIMMPCPWIPDMIQYLSQHPEIDAGLHVTHTSEWKDYRWPSVSGAQITPGLSDGEGMLWSNVNDVVHHASANEIEAEIVAQLKKARAMGLKPTHLDTHMGTLWATPENIDRYITTGIREHLPILFSAGHNTLLREALHNSPLAGLNTLVKNDGQHDSEPAKVLSAITQKGEQLWKGGLAVVDDLYLSSYDWQFPSNLKPTDENLRKFKTEKYKALLRAVKPGITVILIHCTDAQAAFANISDSGITRRGDLLAMTDPELRTFMEQEGFITTTWRELQRRRDAVRK